MMLLQTQSSNLYVLQMSVHILLARGEGIPHDKILREFGLAR